MKNIFFVRLCLSAALFAPIGANAQVTIGSNVPPQATLDIIGDPSETGQAFRLIDGNQAHGRVLMAQGDNGIGTWTDLTTAMDELGYVEVPELFRAGEGWEIITQAAQRFGKIVQFRVQIRNTVPINLDAWGRPTNNVLIVNSRIPTFRYMFITLYPRHGATGLAVSGLSQVLFATTRLDVIRFFGEGETAIIPADTQFTLTAMFMMGTEQPDFSFLD